MLSFFAENAGNIIVIALLAAVIGLALRSLAVNKKKGKSSCGCDCGRCPSAGMCRIPMNDALKNDEQK